MGIEVEPGAGRQALSAPAQRILIEVARQDRDAQLLSRQGQALARQGEHRRLARAAHRQHEAPGLGGHLVAVAAAIVLGRHGDRVITAIVGAGREADHAAHARGGAWLDGAGLAVAGEGGQPVQAEAHGVAIGIAGAHGDLQHGAAIHEGVAHIADLRCPVGVGHHDRQGDFAHGRRAGAVAVIRGGHGDRVGAGLVVGGGPEQFEGVRIETRPLRQAAHRVAHARAALPVERGSVGPQAQLRLELRVVGIEAEGADPQGLSLQDRAAVGGLEPGGGVGVQHLEHQLAAHAGGDRFAIARRGVGRAQADRDPQLAGLGVAGGPFQPARLGVQAGAARQPGGAVLQPNAAAIRLAEAAGHAAGQLQREPLSLPQDLLAQRPEHRFGVALLHMQVEAFDNRVLAVAGHDRHIVVTACLVVTGGPLQGAAAGVVAGAGGQVAQGDGQAIAIGIGHAQGQVEAFPLLECDVAQRLDRGQLVGAGHRQAEAAQGDAAAAVHHPHHHLAVDPVVGCGRPAEAGAGGIARLGLLHRGGGGDPQTGGGLHQLPEEQRAVAVGGLQGGRPGLAHRRSRKNVALRVGGACDRQGRGRVGVGQGVDAVAQIQLGQPARSRRGAQHAGGAHLHRLPLNRGPRRQHTPLGGQGGIEIEDPEIVLVAAAALGRADLALEIAARIEQQQHRCPQIVGADVGDAHVVADLAGTPGAAGVAEVQPQAGA